MATINVTQNQGFDQTYYLAAKAAQLNATSTGQVWTAASVQSAFTAAGLTAEQHYSTYGYKEGLSPNAYYDDNFYALSKVNGTSMTVDQFRLQWLNASGSDNLYTHYMQYGAFENSVNPSSGFNDQDYYAAKAAQMGGSATPASAEAAIKAAGLNAVSHYLLYGGPNGTEHNVNYTPTTTGPSDTSFTLTTGTDVHTANVFEAPTVVSQFGATLDTLQTVDNITGSGANPTLNATIGSQAVAKPTMTGIETVNLTNVRSAVGVGNATIDLGNTTGMHNLSLDSYNLALDGFRVNNIQNNVDLAVKNMMGAGTGDDIRFANTVLAGTADTVALSLTNDGTGTNAAGATGIINVAGMSTGVAETLAVTVNGINNVQNITSAVAGTNGATTINFTGVDGQITVQGPLTNVTTVDGSHLTGTGHMTVTVDATKDVTVTGGAGNDDVNFTTGLTIADKYDGGAGRDTLRVSADNGGLGTGNHISNVEILRVDAATALSAFTFDNDKVTSIDTIVDNHNALSGAMTYTNMNGAHAADATMGLTLLNTGATTFDIKGAATGAADALSVHVGSATGNSGVNFTVAGVGAAAGTLTATGLETLNLNVVANDHSAGGSTSTGIGTISDNSVAGTLTKMNITGGEVGANFMVNTTGGGAANATAALATIDASTFVGNLTVTGNNVVDTHITGGSGNDALTGGTLNDTIVGGAGNDVIKGAANADILTGGAGVDNFVVLSGTADSAFVTVGLTTVNHIDSITDFTSGTDHIQLGVTLDTLNQGSAYSAASTGNLQADIGTAATAGGLAAAHAENGYVVTITSGADAGTYLFFDNNNDGVVQNGETVIHLTGTSSHAFVAADFTV